MSCMSALQHQSRKGTAALVRAGAVPIVQRVLDQDVLDDNQDVATLEGVLKTLKNYKDASRSRARSKPSWKTTAVKLVLGLLACALGYRALAKPKPAPKRTWTAKKKATPRNKKAPAGKRGKKAPRPKPAPKAVSAVSQEADPESSSESEPEPVPKPAPALRRRAKPRSPPVVSDPKALETWSKTQLKKITGSDDLTLVHFCMTLADSSEIRQYLSLYLGSTPQVAAFANEFIQRKSGKADTKTTNISTAPRQAVQTQQRKEEPMQPVKTGRRRGRRANKAG